MLSSRKLDKIRCIVKWVVEFPIARAVIQQLERGIMLSRWTWQGPTRTCYWHRAPPSNMGLGAAVLSSPASILVPSPHHIFSPTAQKSSSKLQLLPLRLEKCWRVFFPPLVSVANHAVEGDRAHCDLVFPWDLDWRKEIAQDSGHEAAGTRKSAPVSGPPGGAHAPPSTRAAPPSGPRTQSCWYRSIVWGVVCSDSDPLPSIV